jgi:L-ascorbate metabolism protein UlaG (beta-lactamase superfamily)
MKHSRWTFTGLKSRICFMRFALICVVGVLSPIGTSLGWAADRISTPAGAVEITPIEHASFTLGAGNKLIYIDPSPAQLFQNKSKADLILITDIHGDHMDPAAVKELSRPDTEVIAPAAVAKTIHSAKVIKNGEKTTWGNWRIEAVPMYNLKRGPAPGQLYHTKGRGNGYVLSYGGTRFYISGDTEDTPEMRSLKNIDVAFICMNLPYTMTPAEAAAAVKAFHPKIVYPYHYRGQDPEKFVELLKGTGIEVRLREWYPQ